jgi:hypothetical protein
MLVVKASPGVKAEPAPVIITTSGGSVETGPHDNAALTVAPLSMFRIPFVPAVPKSPTEMKPWEGNQGAISMRTRI